LINSACGEKAPAAKKRLRPKKSLRPTKTVFGVYYRCKHALSYGF